MLHHNFHIDFHNWSSTLTHKIPFRACKNPYALPLQRIYCTLHIMFDVNPFEIVKFKNTICRTCDSKNIKLKITIGKITLCFRCSCELLTYCVLGIVLHSVFVCVEWWWGVGCVFMYAHALTYIEIIGVKGNKNNNNVYTMCI